MAYFSLEHLPQDEIRHRNGVILKFINGIGTLLDNLRHKPFGHSLYETLLDHPGRLGINKVLVLLFVHFLDGLLDSVDHEVTLLGWMASGNANTFLKHPCYHVVDNALDCTILHDFEVTAVLALIDRVIGLL